MPDSEGRVQSLAVWSCNACQVTGGMVDESLAQHQAERHGGADITVTVETAPARGLSSDGGPADA